MKQEIYLLSVVCVFAASACSDSQVSGPSSDQSVLENDQGVLETCGNDLLDAGEDCELTLELTDTCQSLGFDGGTLSCTEGCSFDFDVCDLPPSEVVISRVHSNVLSGGQTYTIEGTGFGYKSTGAPVKWDDLTSPVYNGYGDGDVFPTKSGLYGHPKDENAPWSHADFPTTSNSFALDDNDRRIEGQKTYVTKEYKGNALVDLGDTGGKFLMADWWTYPFETEPTKHAIKLARFWIGSNGEHGRVTIVGDYVVYSKGAVKPISGHAYGDDWLIENEWQHYRVTIDSSGDMTPGAGHGKFKFYRNNILMTSFDDLSRSPGATSGSYTFWRQMGLIDYSTAVTPHVGESYFSDIYMDNTQAMVAIGDAPLWSQVRHYEMQTATSWSSSEIGFTANLGSFTEDEQVFLFVINSGGVASNGQGVELER